MKEKGRRVAAATQTIPSKRGKRGKTMRSVTRVGKLVVAPLATSSSPSCWDTAHSSANDWHREGKCRQEEEEEEEEPATSHGSSES